MKIKCSLCEQEVTAIEQQSFTTPSFTIYFFPYHGTTRDYGSCSFRTKYITCNQSLMKADPTELVNE